MKLEERPKEMSRRVAHQIVAVNELAAAFAQGSRDLLRHDQAASLRALKVRIVNEVQDIGWREAAARVGHNRAIPVRGIGAFALGSFLSAMTGIGDQPLKAGWRRVLDGFSKEVPYGRVLIAVGREGLPGDVSIVPVSRFARESNEVVKIYTEEESAWRSGHQKELANLIADARRRKFQAVLVWALDRLSREGALAIPSLVQKLSACGVKVLSYQESWTEAPGELAELLYALTGWVARMESQRRSERTKAGLARVKAQGKKLSRPNGSKDKKKRKKRRI